MAKKSDEPLKKHTLMLFDGDFERLQNIYPDLGAGIVIRRIVREYLSKIAPPARVKPRNIDL